MKTRDMLSWAKASNEDMQELAATETHAGRAKVAAEELRGLEVDTLEIYEDRGAMMPCGHPRGCVISSGATNHCGWCEAEGRAEAAEEQLVTTEQQLQVERDRNTGMRKHLTERTSQLRTSERRRGNVLGEVALLKEQLAEAQEGLDSAGIGGIYDVFTSIPDAVYQMVRYVKDVERQLADGVERIAELERLVPEADALETSEGRAEAVIKRLEEAARASGENTKLIARQYSQVESLDNTIQMMMAEYYRIMRASEQQLAEKELSLKYWIALSLRLEGQLAEAQQQIAELERLVPEATFLECAAEALELSSAGWRTMRKELEAHAAAIREYREGK